jgi:DNA-binding protein H-NS
MSMNIDDLSLKELKDLQAKVSKAISTFEDRKKKNALAELEEKARAMGVSLAELTGAVTKIRRRAPATPKYANPADTSETWSGRGRKPRWFAAALKAGKSPEDLSI